MKTEFRRVDLPRELRALTAFDRKIFNKADRFPAAVWREYDSYWMLVEGRRVGCCAFQKHVVFREDLDQQDATADGGNLAQSDVLYIASTGILPVRQGQGLGTLLKSWEIAYARHHGFTRIITNCRKSNKRMIALNRKFGFRHLRTTPGYYAVPVEATVVMELHLK